MPHPHRGWPRELPAYAHAEQNAIIQAAYHGVSVTGASIYSTHQPCLMCVKMTMNSGIEEVRYAGGYPDPLAMELAAEGGLEMLKMDFAPDGA